MTHVDSVFRTAHGKLKGSEDYALCGKFNGFSYGIVADGCGSSKHAALGARLLALGVEKEIRQSAALNGEPFVQGGCFEASCLANQIICAAIGVKSVMESLKVDSPVDYMSTLICILSIEERDLRQKLFVCGFGDGGFFYKVKNKDHLFGFMVEFSNNAPYYPLYETYKSNYLDQVDPEGKEYVTFNEGIGTRGIFPFHDKVSLSEFVEKEKFFVQELFCDELDFALIVSDGIGSIIGKQKEYDSWDAAKEIFNFKSMHGDFLQRRVNAHFKREEKEGCFHMDDFSAAGIVFNEN